MVLVNVLNVHGLLVALVLGQLASDGKARNLLQQCVVAEISVCVINLVALEYSHLLLDVVQIRNIVV